MQVKIVISMVVCLVIAAGVMMLLGENQKARAHTLMMTVHHVKSGPAGLDDPIWDEAKAVQLLVEGREPIVGADGTVNARALYTDDHLYFLFNWKDPTRSVIKESWQFDGQHWYHLKGNEDRIALLFEITRINKFSTRGCAITCHSPADIPRDQWKLATKTEDEKGDLWHWKAARSAPYNYADDAWLTVAGNPTGSYRETGRRKDAGEGGDIRNETPDKTRPLYMQDPNRRPSAPGFLVMEEAVEINDYSIFKAGDIIPYRLPVKPNGSRFDVKAISRYADGRWTVMLYRKLNTGHEDDVIFNPKRRHSFALAIFDDSGSEHSKATEPMTMVFIH